MCQRYKFKSKSQPLGRSDWIQDQIDIGRSVVDIENEFVEVV